MPNISPKVNRRWKSCFSAVLYRKSIAARDDRNATNFLAAVCIAATVYY
jgi:hypothetical protein